MTVNLAPIVVPVTTVEVAPTETELCIVDTRFTDVLTVQITNVSGDAQVLAGVVYRRLDNAMAWAASTLADFSAIADGVSVVADMDVRGTGYIKITASYSGAGADAIVVARRRAI